ncbi:MAG: RNase adapter RapZ, partial [Paracoccaceae bacterium]
LGIDVRNRDFSTSAVMAAIDRYWAEPDQGAELLYLDCSREVLIRRYSETRRRHPMAPAETPVQGIEREIEILAPIRARASVLIDTSGLTPHDLRAEIERWFGAEPQARLAVSVQSFSYKRGTPRGVDMMFDCRFLRNPFWDKELRQLDGLSDDVSAFVQADPRFDAFFQSVHELMQLLLPAYAEEGKSHITIAFGCTGGQHRSVAVAEKLANALAASGWQVSKRHRELGQRGDGGAVSHGRVEDRT